MANVKTDEQPTVNFGSEKEKRGDQPERASAGNRPEAEGENIKSGPDHQEED